MSNSTENTKKEIVKTKVGGQALIEGIMMLGPQKGCMAVRKPDRTIYTEVWERQKPKWYNKAPFIRGCINFVSQMADGYKYINKSGEISGMFDEEEDEKPDKKSEDKTEKSENPLTEEVPEPAPEPAPEADTQDDTAEKAVQEDIPAADEKTEITEAKSDSKDENKGESSALSTVIMIISGLLGVGLAIALFVILPTLMFSGVQYLCGDADISPFRSLFEGIIKIGIFIFYLWVTSLMKTMKRLYQYHGAEHKTIFCYEHGEELTVENIRKYKRFHPRCGTSFIFLTLAISILVYSVLPINSEMFVQSFGVSQFIGDMLRVCCKIIFLPIVVGISYELIRIAGKYDNIFTKILSAPGLAIQRLTTKEPDDEMMEIAIAAVTPVLPERPEDAKW